MTSEGCCRANEWPQGVIHIVHTVAYTHQQPRACTYNTHLAVDMCQESNNRTDQQAQGVVQIVHAVACTYQQPRACTCNTHLPVNM